MSIIKALDILNQNGVVAFPTETVYGLGAKIDSDEALKKIFSTKERPFFDPLIVHVDTIDKAKACFKHWNPVAECMAKNFWPGPLTIVMEKSELISDVITSGLSSVGVRIPDHPVALELLQKIKIPLAAPSANKFGKTSPTSAAHVKKEFLETVYVLESDIPCQIGIESTVLLVRNNLDISILRPGLIVKSEIEKILIQNKVSYQWKETVDKKESPGHLKHHYMPEIPFVICRNPHMKVKDVGQIVDQRLSALPDEVEGVKILKPGKPVSKIEFLKLAETPQQAAREIYSQLRTASERKPDLLCLALLKDYSAGPDAEMWDSVLDRLFKAASLVID
ncbi:MAG: threonylcarbamoyl-AMP synthase [Moraxellaceae bacterium]|nr:threonylcarbamoyl-AMP synthase [Pseudobdellovibrionaceae bacterium]